MNNEICNLINHFDLNQRIKKSWDANVLIRASDLEKETDTSYINLIMPWVLNKVSNKINSNSSILDIGCGCGYLTNAIYQIVSHNITGIDISSVSINYAQKKYPNISFLCDDICHINEFNKYDLCLAVMTLNNMPDIQSFFNVIKKILVVGGTLIIVIPHPCFWPQQHLVKNEFVYSKEIPYEFSFSTKGCKDYSSSILYFHRMLETYLAHIAREGFVLTDFHEVNENDIKRNPDILCMEVEFSPKNK